MKTGRYGSKFKTKIMEFCLIAFISKGLWYGRIIHNCQKYTEILRLRNAKRIRWLPI